MKRPSLSTLALALLYSLLFVGVAHAQTYTSSRSRYNTLPTGTDFPGSPATNDIFVITDDSAIGECDSDAGSAVTLCRWDGDSWDAIGDGGGGSAGGSDTQIQYNNGGSALGGIANFIYDDTNIELADDFNLAFGTSAEWMMNYDDSVDDQLLIMTSKTAAIATTDPMVEILVDTGEAGVTADQQVFGVAKGSQSSNTPLLTLDEDGDLVVAGTVSAGASNNPCYKQTDSDGTDGDVSTQFCTQLTDTGSGTEDSDVTFSQQIAGAMTAFITADADGTGTARLILPDDSIGEAELTSGFIVLPVQSAKLAGACAVNGDAANATGPSIDAGESAWMLLFDDDADEGACWQFVMPETYNGGAVDVRLLYKHVATTCEVTWEAAWCADTDGETVETVGCGDNNTTLVTTPGTAGLLDTAVVAFTNSADAGSVAKGDIVQLQVSTDADGGAGVDDCVGDSELLGVLVEW